MRIAIGVGVIAAALAGQATAAELVFRDAVARVVVIPEARSDIQVEVQQGRNGAPAVQVSRSADSVTVYGDSRTRQCNSDGDGGGWVKLRGGPRIDMDDAAVVTIRAPLSLRISGGGPVWGQVGRTENLSIDQTGCASWTIANVAGTLETELTNGASVRGGTAGTARLGATNGGAVRIVQAGKLDARATNGGAVKAGAVSGEVNANASGGGVVSIEGGATRVLTGNAHGGAVIKHGGRVGELSIAANGGSSIKVAQASHVLTSSRDTGSVVSVGDGAD